MGGGRNEEPCVQHIVRLTTDLGTSCDECDYFVGKSGDDSPIAADVDHYVKEHSYQILHVGQETTHNNEGRPFHLTVVVLGTEDRTNFDRVCAERDRKMEEFDKFVEGRGT